MKMKTIVNLITTCRIIGAIFLLFVEPMSAVFFAIYIMCIVSDIIDGPIARKTNSATNFGALYDSIADIAFIAAVLFVFLPLLPSDPAFGLWIFYLVGVVVVTRLLTWAIGFAKYRTLTLLHTYANKGAGLIMASFPIFWALIGLTPAFLIVFAAAFLSAFEELIITIISKELKRNVTTVFDKKGW